MTQTLAEYLLVISEDEVTALCERHAQAFELVMMSMDRECDIYTVDPDDEPMMCHACDLAGRRPDQPRIILTH